jgi:aspartate 1-decarboxylase
MRKTLLKSKLHRINVTQVELDYEGSCAIDKEFIEIAGMQEYEKIEVYNVTNGERFSTYLILLKQAQRRFLLMVRQLIKFLLMISL